MAAVARASNILAYPERRIFEVYPHDAADQAHVLTASSAEEAALAFLEAWHPGLDPGEAVDITVVDRRTGEAARLVLDVE